MNLTTRRRWLLGGSTLALVAGFTWWTCIPPPGAPGRGPAAAAESAPAGTRPGPQRVAEVAPLRPDSSYVAPATDGPDRAMTPHSAAGAATNPPAAPPPVVADDAARSLAGALQDGDARTPPLATETVPIERATATELADPAAYRRYENRAQARLYRAFEQEAVIALNDMDRDLQRARAAGLSPEQIAEGEEKQRRLAETLERMRRGELDNR